MTQQDKSNYFKGMLILIGKDKKISEIEKLNLQKLAKILDFNKEFCDNAISELLDNEYIIETPPLFSEQEIAKSFIIDGIKTAFADNELHIFELNWLKSVAEKNSLDQEWCLKQFNASRAKINENDSFEIEKFLKPS